MSNDQTKAGPTDEQAEKCSLRLCCRSDEHAEGCTTYDPARYPDKSEPAAQQAAPSEAKIGEQTVLAELPAIWNKLREAYRRGASEQGADAMEYKAAEDLMLGWDLPDAPATAGMVGQDAKDAALEPVPGDLLPPVGSKVLIHLGRQDAWVEHEVVGYYVWSALSHQVKEGEKNAHRVFVRVCDADGYFNARLLSDVRPAAALAAQQAQASAKDAGGAA